MTQGQPQRRDIDTSEFSPKLRMLAEEHRALIDWALRYNAYKRLGAGPSELVAVLRPLTDEIEASGTIPKWAGVDLLRGLAFWLVRMAAHHEAPEYALEDETFWLVVNALRDHPAARYRDRPPTTG